MPHYEFLCHDCKQTFSRMIDEADYEKGKIACPHCGSRKVQQQVSPAYAVTSKKNQSQNNASRERVNLSASEEDDRARVLSDWEGEGGASGGKKEADKTAETPSRLPGAAK